MHITLSNAKYKSCHLPLLEQIYRYAASIHLIPGPIIFISFFTQFSHFNLQGLCEGLFPIGSFSIISLFYNFK